MRIEQQQPASPFHTIITLLERINDKLDVLIMLEVKDLDKYRNMMDFINNKTIPEETK